MGDVAYRLALPSSLEGVYTVFHVSRLHRYIPDLGHILKEEEEVRMKEDLSCPEYPLRILDRKE